MKMYSLNVYHVGVYEAMLKLFKPIFANSSTNERLSFDDINKSEIHQGFHGCIRLFSLWRHSVV